MPVLPPAPAYDEQRRGIVDPRTHSFRPNINAHATPSPVDVRAAEAGTNATGPSPAFLKAFPNRPGALDRAAEAQRVEAVPANKSIANAPAIQSALDRAAGVGQNPSAGVTTAPSNFGSGSVRFAKAGENLPPATVSANGVTRADPFDRKTAEAALYKIHPEIFQDGTPQNAAFLAHLGKYGEQSAFQNAPDLMKTLNPASAVGATGATAKNDMSGAPSAEQLASYNAALKAPPPGALIDPNSTLGKVAAIPGQIAGAPSAIGQGVKDLAKGALGAVGVTPEGIAKVGGAVRGAADAAVNALKPLDNAVQSGISGIKSYFSDGGDNAPTVKSPSQPPVTPAPPVATNPTAPDPAEEARKRLAANNQNNGSGY